jgi:ATP-dependent helicase HrpB
VLVAPPGAGKTTRVPLVLAAEPWAAGKKLIVLEPRRLAARAAAARMAATLNEAVGASVGYRVRFGSKVSAATRIEVVTEGAHRAGGGADARRDRSTILRSHRKPRRDRLR